MQTVVKLEFNLQKLYLSAIGDRTTKERPGEDKDGNNDKTRLDGADQGI